MRIWPTLTLLLAPVLADDAASADASVEILNDGEILDGGQAVLDENESSAVLEVEVSEITYDTLTQLYQFSGGVDWAAKTNWMNGDPCLKAWYGLSCMETEEEMIITEIDLSENSLVGPLPSELGLLTGITSNFKMQQNALTGTIPTELGLLTGMESYFLLFSTDLTGEVPTELGMMTAMKKRFYLAANSLTGEIPSELGALRRIQDYFYLHNNEFCGEVPEEVTQLTDKMKNKDVVTGNDIGEECALGI